MTGAADVRAAEKAARRALKLRDQVITAFHTAHDSYQAAERAVRDADLANPLEDNERCGELVWQPGVPEATEHIRCVRADQHKGRHRIWAGTDRRLMTWKTSVARVSTKS